MMQPKLVHSARLVEVPPKLMKRIAKQILAFMWFWAREVTSRPAQTSNTTVLRLSTGGNETTTPLGD
eukprot:4938774-Amphidinium_carterae.1